jgi:hypothetical protein
MVGGAWKEDSQIRGQKNAQLWWSCCSRSWAKKVGVALAFWHLHDNPCFEAFTPTFHWTHNNNEAITICDGIYNKERVSIFYLVPWCVRFLRLYTFSKGLNIPLIHPLRGVIEKNYGQWLSKRLNSRPWETIFTIMQEEGPMLFTSGVGSLARKG